MLVLVFVVSLLFQNGLASSSCQRYGSEWVCGERMCAASGLTRYAHVGTHDATPQSLEWDPTAYAQALKLFDDMQAFLLQGRIHPPLLLPPSGADNVTSGTQRAQNKQQQHLQPNLIKEAISAIRGSLRLYGPEGTFVSFNGGKDATVVVNLYVAVLANYYRENKMQDRRKPATVYFHVATDFESVRQFIHSQAERLDLDLRVYEGSYKERLETFLEDIGGVVTRGTWERHPAFLLGLRNGDPGSDNVGVFEPVSTWFYSQVPYMRVHPILKWTYGAVWAFFDEFKIPYCSLYDEGYSSLGQISETRQNKLLARGSGGDTAWTPAKYLTKWSEERSGRDRGSSTSRTDSFTNEVASSSPSNSCTPS